MRWKTKSNEATQTWSFICFCGFRQIELNTLQISILFDHGRASSWIPTKSSGMLQRWISIDRQQLWVYNALTLSLSHFDFIGFDSPRIQCVDVITQCDGIEVVRDKRGWIEIQQFEPECARAEGQSVRILWSDSDFWENHAIPSQIENTEPVVWSKDIVPDEPAGESAPENQLCGDNVFALRTPDSECRGIYLFRPFQSTESVQTAPNEPAATSSQDGGHGICTEKSLGNREIESKAQCEGQRSRWGKAYHEEFEEHQFAERGQTERECKEYNAWNKPFNVIGKVQREFHHELE